MTTSERLKKCAEALKLLESLDGQIMPEVKKRVESARDILREVMRDTVTLRNVTSGFVTPSRFVVLDSDPQEYGISVPSLANKPQAKTYTHFARVPFVAICGADAANQATSAVADYVTCPACVKAMCVDELNSASCAAPWTAPTPSNYDVRIVDGSGETRLTLSAISPETVAAHLDVVSKGAEMKIVQPPGKLPKGQTLAVVGEIGENRVEWVPDGKPQAKFKIGDLVFDRILKRNTVIVWADRGGYSLLDPDIFDAQRAGKPVLYSAEYARGERDMELSTKVVMDEAAAPVKFTDIVPGGAGAKWDTTPPGNIKECLQKAADAIRKHTGGVVGPEQLDAMVVHNIQTAAEWAKANEPEEDPQPEIVIASVEDET